MLIGHGVYSNGTVYGQIYDFNSLCRLLLEGKIILLEEEA